MRLLFRLDSIAWHTCVLQQDRWKGNSDGNCTVMRVCKLRFKQVSVPEVPKYGALCGWPQGKMSLVLEEKDAARYELGKSYWFGDEAVPVIGQI
jgi:hypothetical protein